jgi:hypothetical protein
LNRVELLDRAWERGRRPDQAPASIRALMSLADEVSASLAAARLSRAERERIYTRTLAMIEDAVEEQRRGWQRVLRLEHPAPALVGGAAALTIGVLAVGWAVLHDRHRGAPRQFAA